MPEQGLHAIVCHTDYANRPKVAAMSCHQQSILTLHGRRNQCHPLSFALEEYVLYAMLSALEEPHRPNLQPSDLPLKYRK